MQIISPGLISAGFTNNCLICTSIARIQTCALTVLHINMITHSNCYCMLSQMCQKRTYTLSGEDYELLDAPTPHARIS